MAATPYAGGEDRSAPEDHGRAGDGERNARRVLIAFAGDGRAQSTLEAELRARGADVDAVDVA
eukprot:4625569-Pleurochrysis_carterae.AAC.1